MKNVLRLLPVLMALWLGAAAHALTTITPATHEVGAGTVPYQILVDSNVDWTASTAASWVTLSRTAGSQSGNILVTAVANTTGSDRSATVVVDGITHTITQRSAGTALQELWAWGNDGYGQLGDNNAPRFWCLSPEGILGSGVQSVAAGAEHSLIVKTDGSLWAMGSNTYGQLGDGTTISRPSPVRIFADGVQSVSARGYYSLIVKTDGSLWGMGNLSPGLGAPQPEFNRTSPVLILASGVQSVSAGGGQSVTSSMYHWLIVKTDGSLWGMGANFYGQLGDGTRTERASPVPILASGVRAVSAGAFHSLIVKTDGSLWGMGAGVESSGSPALILADGVQSVAAGDGYSLIVKTDGSLWGLGDNSCGQLGDGTTTNRPSPVRIFAEGVHSAAAVGRSYVAARRTVVEKRSLIVKTDGSLWAMGDNSSGQLGDGTTTTRTSPVQILAGGVKGLAAGNSHSLVARADGSLWAMGDNSSGQLGDGSTTIRMSPLQILAGGLQSIVGGAYHTLVVRTDGSLWAMGRNTDGQLGDGTTSDRMGPVPIFLGGVQSVSAGIAHSLIVKTDGSLWATGDNSSGQLGDGTTTDRASPVPALADGVRSVAAGGYHSLIVKTDGSLWAMGDNTDGQLGDGTTSNRMSPVPILASGVQSVAAGTDHSLIVKTDGSLWAMGGNTYGQLGDGTSTNRSSPVPILASGVRSVAAGAGQSFVVKTDGSLWAMGHNLDGELGDGTTINRLRPVLIFAGGVQAIAAGGSHSLVLKTDGTLWAVGDNTTGQLGDGTKLRPEGPVLIAGNVQMMAAGADHSLIVASGDPVPVEPVVRIQPVSRMAIAGQNTTLTVGTNLPSGVQWYRGGHAVAGGADGTLTLSAITPAEAGIYDAVLSAGTATALSRPAVVGVTPAYGERTAGSVTTRAEWQDINHPNGAVYDQFLLTGAAGTFTADPGQIARCSFLDNNNSIVQVEMFGAGAITIVLDGATGPMAPALYNQPGVQYMKGKATIILAGCDASTHFTIYSVGTFNNPGVTRPDETYNGWADVAAAGIVSSSGALGGIHHGNVAYSASAGYTGIYAPTVDFVASLVVVHGVEASGTAQPYLNFRLGGSVGVKIAGGSLAQPNGDSVTVGGLAEVQMGAGQDSCGRAAPAQAIGTRLLDEAGNDRTDALVTRP